ncbi:MAG: lactonase family protein [Chitinophagaceae bacterium]|nr:lactonase family protein [Chitinophagaceae bacterium]
MSYLKSVLFASILLFLVSGAGVYAQSYNLLIGTYTSGGKSEGIYVYDFNLKTGAFKHKSTAKGITNPSYLAISKSRKKVYSVSEAGKGKGGISAFNFDPVSGELTFINSVSSGGDGPCYVEVDDKDQYVFSGNYGGGTLGAIRVNADGSLNGEVQSIKHEGSSVNKDNQSKPHVHCTVLSPDNNYLMVADLGTDKVHTYRFSHTGSEPLSPSEPAYVSTKPGAGPRHLTFHPNGKFAYVVNELDGSVNAFGYHDGKLTSIQTITMLKPGFSGTIEGADIHCSPDGKFLYASNREISNEIVIYSIAKNGSLTFVGRQSTLGKAPRNFAIDPSGKFLLCANQNTDEIVLFKRNFKTGLLTDTGKRIAVGRPVCLKFVAGFDFHDK